MTRAFNKIDAQYKEWKRKVKSRDGHKCQFPGCGVTKRLQAHHIRRWADCPLLRYEPSNGITLCWHHHRFISGEEQRYEPIFRTIINGKTH